MVEVLANGKALDGFEKFGRCKSASTPGCVLSHCHNATFAKY